MLPSERIHQLALEVINKRPGTTPAEALSAGIVAYLNEQHRFDEYCRAERQATPPAPAGETSPEPEGDEGTG